MARSTTLRAVEAHAISYRRTWRGSVFTSIVSPVLFLAGIGLGLGSLVDAATEGDDALGGVDYLTFLAPGLLAAAAMQTAANEATWPIMAGIRWLKTYHAALATPVGAAQVALGQLAWIGVRLAITAVTFTAVMVAFGATESATVVLGVPAAVLTGLAFACPIAAFTARLENEYGLSNLLRFGIVPMFLFSGTFFPVSQLPGALQPVAYATPLWHGVELCRSLALGQVDVGSAGLHVAYLSAWAGVGAALAVWRFRVRLVT